jgi:hypothetical protein
MLEYETFAYLGLQKTGSSFIADFLRRFCREACVSTHKHWPTLAEAHSREKLYIISVRDPLDQYLSLYSYGVEGKGKLHGRLSKQGYDSFYDGTPDNFRQWLRTILRPSNAQLLNRAYAKIAGGKIARIVGYQSFRYLNLAMPSPEALLEHATDQESLRRAFEKNNVVGFAIRNERLNSDLASLVQGRLRNSIADPDAALTYLETAERINASNRVDKRGVSFDLGDRLKARLHDREWLLHELFNY